MIPSLVGRMPLGKSESHPLAQTGGSETVALTTEQVPEHSHTGTTNSGGNHVHSIQIFTPSALGSITGNHMLGESKSFPYLSPSDNVMYAVYETDSNGTTENGNHTHEVSVSGGGPGQPHNNMPPYISLNMIIKT